MGKLDTSHTFEIADHMPDDIRPHLTALLAENERAQMTGDLSVHYRRDIKIFAWRGNPEARIDDLNAQIYGISRGTRVTLKASWSNLYPLYSALSAGVGTFVAHLAFLDPDMAFPMGILITLAGVFVLVFTNRHEKAWLEKLEAALRAKLPPPSAP